MTLTNEVQASMPDDENPEWTEGDFAKSRPALDLIGEVFGAQAVSQFSLGMGQPATPEDGKVNTTLRLDADVLEAYRQDSPGWQARMNQVLREHMPARK